MNKLNNDVKNLSWISYSENVKLENKLKYPKILVTYSEEELKDEIWIPFRDDRYEVSNLGRLKNVDTNKILEGHINHTLLYIRDTLCFRDGHREIIPRHRIVWEGFHPDEKIKIINHIDGDKTNNRLSNLENVTFSENSKKAYVETQVKATRKCLGINQSTGENKVFFSIADAAIFMNCEESNIRSALNRKNKVGGGSSHGWKWFNLTNEEYNQILESSETIESIIKKKILDE